ncbi:MAG: hypothetical protein HC869_01365 [Rhodospirillales bacterium]|nr:hypothetical protein [Rhodospirillales bacterium]
MSDRIDSTLSILRPGRRRAAHRSENQIEADVQHLGIEGEGTVHVLDGKTEMLNALEPGAERRGVAVGHELAT